MIFPNSQDHGGRETNQETHSLHSLRSHAQRGGGRRVLHMESPTWEGPWDFATVGA